MITYKCWETAVETDCCGETKGMNERKETEAKKAVWLGWCVYTIATNNENLDLVGSGGRSSRSKEPTRPMQLFIGSQVALFI